jgi:hypothetical protein
MKIGATIQILSLEMGLGCNLAHLHPQCPNGLGKGRYQGLPQSMRLTDESMVATVRTFYEDFDFKGWVNFSFYNEPTLELPRLFRLVDAVRDVAPEVRFMLLTNGTLLPDDLRPFEVFDWIGVTDYGGGQTPDAMKILGLYDAAHGVGRWDPEPKGVFVTKGKLDRRMRGLGADRSHIPCLYPFKDLTIDVFGNAHLCCMDWRGLAQLGNVLIDGVPEVLQRWERMVRSISGARMTAEAPPSCRTCQSIGFQRLDTLSLRAKRAAEEWLGERR